jgi:hypothetical protein
LGTRGVKREQLKHILPAASQIAADPDVAVIGSQSLVLAIQSHPWCPPSR